jgi:hypothetical protein
VDVPFVGQITYAVNGDAKMLGLLAVVGFFLAIVNLTSWSAIPGVLCLGLIGRSFYIFTMAQGATPGVAWPVLVIGAVMLIAASCMQELKGLRWKAAVPASTTDKPKPPSGDDL